MVYRANYEIPISTRIDKETKQKLDNIALAKNQKPAELLRDIIIEFVERSAGILLVDNEAIKNQG